MHTAILSQWLGDRAIIKHAARSAAVVRVVQAVLAGGKLCLTHLGRALAGSAQVKHQIKAVDRLLGNVHLHGERDGIYRAISATLLRGNKRPTIIVDWSDFELDRQWLMLKAAVPVGGRAICIYERVFPFKRYNSPDAHREFLKALRSILPAECKPIIVTDAGFRGPWFRHVESYGWDWVGRIRNTIKYHCEQTGRWRFTNSLYPEATAKPSYVGEVALSKRHRYRFRLYLVRAYKPRVGRPPHRGPIGRGTTMYRKLHRAPWLLATSLADDPGSAERVVELYKQRMQIEETFRDLKGHRWGFALRYARCNSAKRLEILLLVGTLAALVAWLVGLAGRALQLNRHLQANTERSRDVLSTFFIGCQLLLRCDVTLPPPLIKRALLTLRDQIFALQPS